MNCLRIKGHCEGYVIKPRKKRAKPVPKVEAAAMAVAPRVVSPIRILEPDLNSLDFTDQSSMLYFEEFIDLASKYFTLNATYTKLWTVTLPQLARVNPALRHGAIAIGALSKAHEHVVSPAAPALPNLPEHQEDRRKAVLRLREQSPHYHNAIVHYCAALRLQGQAASTNVVVQNTIFISLLFICFELIRGDKRSALRHIDYGTTLLYSIVTGGEAKDDLAILAPDPRYLLAEVADTFVNLATQSRTVLSGRFGREKPLSELSNDVLRRGTSLEQFFLILQRLPRLHRPVDVNSVPAVFRDLREAEEYWMMAQSYGAEIGPVITEACIESGLLELEDDDEINKRMLRLIVDPRLTHITDKLGGILEAWERAFDPLYNRCLMDQTTSRDTYLRILWLKMGFLITRMVNWMPMVSKSGALEKLTPDCREMNVLAEMILRKTHTDASPAHRLSLDGGVLAQIAFVGFFCRDPLVREESIRIMKTYPHRDGLWDSQAHLALAIRNREIEKLNASEGDKMEQWMRLWRREHVFEDAGSRILLRFLDKNEENGKWEIVEEVAELKDDVDEMVWKRQPLTGSRKFMLASILPLQAQEPRN